MLDPYCKYPPKILQDILPSYNWIRFQGSTRNYLGWTRILARILNRRKLKREWNQLVQVRLVRKCAARSPRVFEWPYFPVGDFLSQVFTEHKTKIRATCQESKLSCTGQDKLSQVRHNRSMKRLSSSMDVSLLLPNAPSSEQIIKLVLKKDWKTNYALKCCIWYEKTI